MTINRFFSKNNWKNSYVFGQIDKLILAKKKLGYQFFLLNNFSSTNFPITS